MNEPWTNEDPRMLREQIRVADVAFQHIHEKLQLYIQRADAAEKENAELKGEIEALVQVMAELTGKTLERERRLNSKINAMAGALLEVAAHRRTDRDGNYVMWIGETTFERVQRALDFIVDRSQLPAVPPRVPPAEPPPPVPPVPPASHH